MKPWIPTAALTLALSPLVFVHPVRICGRSMEPALRDGDVRFALRAWCAGKPAEGDIWLVRTPEGAAVKRVVGLPGSHLEQHAGRLFQAGRPIDAPYTIRPDHGPGTWEAGRGYLVAGDNRPLSRDSRAWGPLAAQSFQGRIVQGLLGSR